MTDQLPSSKGTSPQQAGIVLLGGGIVLLTTASYNFTFRAPATTIAQKTIALPMHLGYSLSHDPKMAVALTAAFFGVAIGSIATALWHRVIRPWSVRQQVTRANDDKELRDRLARQDEERRIQADLRKRR